MWLALGFLGGPLLDTLQSAGLVRSDSARSFDYSSASQQILILEGTSTGYSADYDNSTYYSDYSPYIRYPDYSSSADERVTRLIASDAALDEVFSSQKILLWISINTVGVI